MLSIAWWLLWLYNKDFKGDCQESDAFCGYEELRLYELFLDKKDMWPADNLRFLWKPVYTPVSQGCFMSSV